LAVVAGGGRIEQVIREGVLLGVGGQRCILLERGGGR